jgi:glycosyltransferase involved in cell wall biosynthesis
MKKISVVIPTFNEEENVVPLSEEIIGQFDEFLPDYDYEIIFCDNASTDRTQELLTGLCAGNKKIKAVFNAINAVCVVYGFYHASGDCVVFMNADFQTPAGLIPQMVKEWEAGCKIVCCIKNKSKESRIMWLLRSIFYKLLNTMSDVEIIRHFTGFGLYDKSVMKIYQAYEQLPLFRVFVSEIGIERKEIYFVQPKRRAGKSSHNMRDLYAIAMRHFTSYTKAGLRVATILGMVVSFLSIAVGLVYLVLKLLYWDRFPAGNIPILIGVFILGGIQIFFIGLVGEYILSINEKLMKKPYVIVDKLVNFDGDEDDSKPRIIT